MAVCGCCEKWEWESEVFFFFGQQGNNIKLGNNKSVTT